MKRFIAYISMCLTMILGVVVSVAPSVKNLNANIDYDYGREFVYKIEGDEEFFDDTAINEVSDMFVERLNAADVTTYKLETIGNDMLRLQYRVEYDIYDQISTLLTVNPNFSILSSISESTIFDKTTNENNDIFKPGSAVIEQDINGYPTVVLTLNTSEESLSRFNEIRKEAASKITTSEEGETTIPDDGYLYFVNNWKDNYNITDLVSYANGTNVTIDSEVADTYMFRLDPRLSNFFYDYDSSKDPELNSNGNSDEKVEVPPFTKIRFQLYGGNHTNPTQNVVQANKEARIWKAYFNTTANDYKISCINEHGINSIDKNIPPFKENLISLTNTLKISASTLLYSTIAAFIIVLAFLALNYGVAGLLGAANASLVTLLPLALISVFKAEFNIGAIIALISVAALSIFTTSNYFKKVKNEVYLGKKLKKANQDVSKATFLNQLDLSVITLIFGVVAYLIPNTILSSVGAVLIIGSIANFIVNTVILRLGYWLLANSEKVNNKLSLLSIDAKLIPNLSEEEQPKYFESYETKQTKKSKIIANSIFGVVLTACIVGLTTFQVLNGNIYKNSNALVRDEVVLKYVSNEENLNYNSKILDSLNGTIYTEVQNEDGTQTHSENAVKFTLKESFYDISYLDSSKTVEYFYIITANAPLNNDSYVYYKESDEVFTRIDFTNAVLNIVNDKENIALTEVNIYQVKNIENASINYYVAIYLAIAVSIVSIYMLLRFNISRALTNLIVVAGISTITIGIFSLMQGAFDATITLGLILVALLANYVFATYFDSSRKYIISKKATQSDLNSKLSLTETNHNIEFSSISIILCFVIFLVTSFILSNSFSSYGILFVFVGVISILLVARFNLYSIESFFINLFNKIKLNFKLPKISSKKKKTTKVDEGPEEAIFYGIND